MVVERKVQYYREILKHINGVNCSVKAQIQSSKSSWIVHSGKDDFEIFF